MLNEPKDSTQGALLRGRREALGLGREKFARLCNISAETVRRAERDDPLVARRTHTRIARVLVILEDQDRGRLVGFEPGDPMVGLR